MSAASTLEMRSHVQLFRGARAEIRGFSVVETNGYCEKSFLWNDANELDKP
jgi:hypothetical protein